MTDVQMLSSTTPQLSDGPTWQVLCPTIADLLARERLPDFYLYQAGISHRFRSGIGSPCSYRRHRNDIRCELRGVAGERRLLRPIAAQHPSSAS